MKEEGLKLNEPKEVKPFLTGPFTYYTDLYVELLRLREEKYNEENPFVYYNTQFTMRGGKGHLLFRLILSGVSDEDSKEEAKEKIKTISKEFDRLFVLLNLQGVSYSNHKFQRHGL